MDWNPEHASERRNWRCWELIYWTSDDVTQPWHVRLTTGASSVFFFSYSSKFFGSHQSWSATVHLCENHIVFENNLQRRVLAHVRTTWYYKYTILLFLEGHILRTPAVIKRYTWFKIIVTRKQVINAKTDSGSRSECFIAFPDSRPQNKGKILPPRQERGTKVKQRLWK